MTWCSADPFVCTEKEPEELSEKNRPELSVCEGEHDG